LPAVVVDDGFCPRQWEQTVRLAIARAQRCDFVGHRLQFGVMRVRGVIASLEHDGIGCREAGEGVDVGVGVVAFQVTVVQPEHAVLLQPVGEFCRQGGALDSRMAFVQALPGAQQGTGPVGVDGATFECKINWVPRVL
jgi:hypothetical protein